MRSYSDRAAAVHESSTLAVSALANKLKAEGKDVINFGTGEPDFDTPENIKEAAVAAIKGGQTKYTPASGLPALKKAICARLLADTGVSYEPGQIVVASGAKHSIYIALVCLLNEGDEAIIPAPYWVTYAEAVAMAGGKPVTLETTAAEDFLLTPEKLEAAITPATKLLILNNPSNPTGMFYTGEQLKALCEICVRHDIWIMADEIYCKLLYDGRSFTSVASLGDEIKERTIIVNGVSKSYAMTGWRIGYTASEPRLAKIMSNYLSHSTSAPSTISQYAAIEALNGDQSSVEEMRRVFQQRRDLMVERMNRIDGVSCLKPEGAFYVMMNIDRVVGRTIGGVKINNENDFAMAFLEQQNVALVPCGGFGISNYLRWTYATSTENIEKGLDRLEAFLKK
ncbi:MAG: pyridoxal phosphate-dependent aminotransferase [Oscillospiraceae bacterium]|nr:pyridoxal phosphate-dependent aminotransferase [Oscillospiraceae bacterium]